MLKLRHVPVLSPMGESVVRITARVLLAMGTFGMLLFLGFLCLIDFTYGLSKYDIEMFWVYFLMAYLVAAFILGMLRLPGWAQRSGLLCHIGLTLTGLLLLMGPRFFTLEGFASISTFVGYAGCYYLTWFGATLPGPHSKSDLPPAPMVVAGSDAEGQSQSDGS